MRDEPLRILVCDDSLSYREALRWFIEHDPDLRVADTVATGEQALDRIPRVRPGLVIMDLELPGMDGVRTVGRIMAEHPLPVLMLSAHTGKGSAQAAGALAAGAIDARSKREISLAAPTSAQSVAFRRYLKRLGYAKVGARRRVAAPATANLELPATTSVVAVAASTGGPQALKRVLGALPADFPLPLLAVQHIADGFLDGFVSWLDGQVALPVGVARPGRPLRPGIWFAPEQAHLVVDRSLTPHFDRDTVAGWHRPSADVLFTSLAASVGAHAMGVVLTGMGSDGADGVSALRATGAVVITQDEHSSVVYGMPRAAAEQGGFALPLDQIGPTIARLTRPAGP